MGAFHVRRLLAFLIFATVYSILSDAHPFDNLGSQCSYIFIHGASRHHRRKRIRFWGYSVQSNEDTEIQISSILRSLFSRGGSSYDDESNSDDDESDEEEDDAEYSSDAEDEESVCNGIKISDNGHVSANDEPWVPSPFVNLYASIFVMMLARKYDLLHPTMVKIARFAFVSYLIIFQIFLLYVRIQVKIKNDSTPLEIKNPLTSVLQSQFGGHESGSMIKKLASSFITTKSTIVEYDIKQTKNMQSGLIFNILFMWVLHFKMEQVQPLFIQTVTGLSNIIYSPLFQVYVLGKNLERPFKSKAHADMEALESMKTNSEAPALTSFGDGRAQKLENELFEIDENEDDSDSEDEYSEDNG